MQHLAKEWIIPRDTECNRSLPVAHRLAPSFPAREYKPRNPSARLRRFEHKPAKTASDPAGDSHQQHGFLLRPTFAEGKKPSIGGSPTFRSDCQLTGQVGPCHHEEEVGALTRLQHSSEKQFVASHPHGRFCADEHAIYHPRNMIWIET